MATANSWNQRLSNFLQSPSQFLTCTTTDSFLTDLLHELRDDKANDNTKILLLSVLLEHPNVLCPTVSVGEETVQDLMSILTHAPQKSVSLKCHLMLTITNVLVCTSCFTSKAKVAEDFLDLLFQTIQDTNDHRGGSAHYPVRATACDCLREIETCYPGLLSQKLEALYQFKQQETTVLHQSYCLLFTLGLKNAIRHLAQQKDVADTDLKNLLTGNEGLAWKCIDTQLSIMFPFNLMNQVPQLQTGGDCKELRSIMTLLLEESYLLTPVSQASLLRELVEIVAMVPALSPAIFKSQLLRLFGTGEVELLHVTLFMKGAFTDSLFSAEDENFFLKRLVGMAQHPLLTIPEKLFYMRCILHFPENRPISSHGEECLPVLVTPRLAASLLPTVFNDSNTMLCRLNLLCLVHLEADEGEEGKGLGYLFDHVIALLKIVDNHGNREMTVTSFKAVFIFLMHFYHMEKYSEKLISKVCELYSKNCCLAPHLINLVDRIQESLEDSVWASQLFKALQKSIVEVSLSQLTLQNLSWHLKILGRVAKENKIPQRNTLYFLLNVLLNSSLCERGSWQVGNAILAVCRNLLKHPTLNQVFIELADLLQYMSAHYEDTDIQDHARFYYTLLTNLSWEKLSGVLAKGADGGQAKIRSLSAIMAESDGLTNCLTIHQTDQPVLQLVKIQNQESQKSTTSATKLEDVEKQGALEFYQEQFLTPGFASEVTLQYILTYTEVNDSLFDRIFSICLHFDLKDSNYAEVSDICVPCLFRDRKPPEVCLKLKPRLPYPTTVNVRAVFTTEDGLSWHTQLPDVTVSFPEVFLPLPLPPGTSHVLKQDVFDHLWNAMSSGESNCAATSLFCFQIGDSSLNDLIKSHFESYLISEQLEQNGCKVLFFLPPKFHVLLKIEQAEDSIQVNIATDNWELLPHVNAYLLNITALSNMTPSHI
ncbi:AP-5 complex subunit beta-1 [Chanos chanos]|uniref:AP-5 complex subunit beta-1 n=1 Tax=Chanos chanos TaxID=29144 RepID=A0A6J2VMF6_CHACN|nr:AP-5 complex subunit beta-1 [Chanos chanos]